MSRNWCVKCLKYQEEEAGEECKNPGWHDGVSKQVGACERCICETPRADQDVCRCCHISPCEAYR